MGCTAQSFQYAESLWSLKADRRFSTHSSPSHNTKHTTHIHTYTHTHTHTHTRTHTHTHTHNPGSVTTRWHVQCAMQIERKYLHPLSCFIRPIVHRIYGFQQRFEFVCTPHVSGADLETASVSPKLLLSLSEVLGFGFRRKHCSHSRSRSRHN